ncbi:hypothetical protein KXD40_006293 [Peronospora effusa]|nr:hypothetical protein KXD40_006294 [Peronospora effusa]UIZ25729.1 hypothetical protein KXD40_006293 [Peronospora effusa]
MKLTAFAVAAALAATTVISADTRALRALTDVTATEAMQPTADAPKEDDDQKEMGWEHRGWGNRGHGHGHGHEHGNGHGHGHHGRGW